MSAPASAFWRNNLPGLSCTASLSFFCLAVTDFAPSGPQALFTTFIMPYIFTAFSRACVSKRDCVLRLGGSRLTAAGIARSRTPIFLSRTSEKNMYLVHYLQSRSHSLRVQNACACGDAGLCTCHVGLRSACTGAACPEVLYVPSCSSCGD